MPKRPAPAKAAPGGEKLTFMLHDPSDMSDIGRFRGNDVWHAALKAASKKHERILLRRTRTKIVHEFAGRRERLAAPKSVIKNGEPVTFEFQPRVEHVRSWEFTTPLTTASGDALAREPPVAAPPEEPAKAEPLKARTRPARCCQPTNKKPTNKALRAPTRPA
jgi:hypothetical protein